MKRIAILLSAIFAMLLLAAWPTVRFYAGRPLPLDHPFGCYVRVNYFDGRHEFIITRLDGKYQAGCFPVFGDPIQRRAYSDYISRALDTIEFRVNLLRACDRKHGTNMLRKWVDGPVRGPIPIVRKDEP